MSIDLFPSFYVWGRFFPFFFYPSLAFYALIIHFTHSLCNGSSDQVMNASSHQYQREPVTPARAINTGFHHVLLPTIYQPFFFFKSVSIAWPELGVESLWGAGHAPTEK